MGRSWEHFPHDADVGVRGFGATPAEAFAHCALAMTAVITDPGRVRPVRAIEIRCEAPALDLLLYEWLNALVFEMATRQMLFVRFEVEIEGERLEARALGEPVDVARHRPAAEIKGATFTALEVARDADGGWRAQCVLDV